MGFPVPAKKWFADALYEQVQDLLSSQEARERGIYNLTEVQRDVELHRQGKIDISDKLFRLVQIEIWSKLGIVRADGWQAGRMESALQRKAADTIQRAALQPN